MPFKFCKDDKVVIKDAGLTVQPDMHTITAPNGDPFTVYWNDRKASMVGKEWTIHSVRPNGMIGIYHEGEYYFHPDWLSFSGPESCTCDFFKTVYGKGCQCGRMVRERLEKERTI